MKSVEKKLTSKSSVEECIEAYLENIEGVNSYSDFRKKKSICNTWLIPNIGELPIGKITDSDIQLILDKAAKLNRSKKTIMNIKGTLSHFLRWCRKRKITSYKFDDVEIPKSARYLGKNILFPDDLKILFESDQTLRKGVVQRDEYINWYRLQVLTGLRPGEMLGLKKTDVHGNILYIRRSINIFNEVTLGKNENAIRPVPLIEYANQIVQEQLKEPSNKDSEFLFPHAHEDVIRDRWRKYLNYNKIGYVTLYELRHTFVSIVKTLPEGEIKSLVGHSKSMDTFGVYAHVVKGEDIKLRNDLTLIFDKLIQSS